MEEWVSISFQKLGLSEYESKALASLTQFHDSTAQQISEDAKIPYTKIYNTLGSLEKRGLIKSTLERPKKYRALDPDSIINSIMKKREKDLNKIKKEFKKNLTKLEETYSKGKKGQGPDKIWFAPTQGAVWNIFIHECKSSKKEVTLIGGTSSWMHAAQDKHISEAILKMLGRGVKIRGIFPQSLSEQVSKLPDSLLQILSHNNMSARILSDEKIHEDQIVIDKKKVGMTFKDSLTKEVHSGVMIENESLAKGADDYFSHLWNLSIPTEKIIREEAKRVGI